MSEKTDLVLHKESAEQGMLVFGNTGNFETAMRMAKCLSSSSIVPTVYQGEKGLSNCIIALEMANRIGASPLMIMQNLYIVHGNPGWSSKFLISCLNTCGKFTPLRYEFKGKENTDEWSCRAYATDKGTGEVLYGAWVSIAMAKAEKWFSKKDRNGNETSKWQTMPELMLQYRSAAFFQRTYAPEISMGMQTAEEVQDVEWVEVPKEEAVQQEITNNANRETISMEEEVPQADNSQTESASQPNAEQPIGEQKTPTIFQ